MFRFSYDSGLNGKCGVYGQSGLYDKSGLYPVEFNVQNLDPYLLFDTSQGSMLGTLESPTLDLDPSNPDTLNVITASRSSVATRTLPDGSIALAEQDTVRVDYTQGDELTPTKYQNIGYTDFDQWTSENATITPNVVDSPFGNQDASKLVATSTSQRQGITIVTSVADSLVASVYAKKGEYDVLQITDARNGSYFVNFDLTNGAVGSFGGVIGEIQNIGNGWFRCISKFTSSLDIIRLRLSIAQSSTQARLVDFAGNGTDGIYIYGPQLEEGTTASSFVANTTGSPKFITGATFGPRVPMILVEPSATNLVEYSEDFSNSYWGKSDVTVASAPVAAPDGTMTASHVVKTGSDGHLSKSSIGAANSHKTSIWARTVSGSGTCFFNYHSGTPSTVTDQWQRFEVTSNTAHIYPVNFRGTSTLTEIYIWGAQLETGSVATSYIPTSGSAVTRAADELVISGSAFSSFFNGSEGTFYIEVIDRTPTENSVYVSGQSIQQAFLYSNVDLAVDSYDGANFQRISGVVANELFRAAATYDSTSKKISLNGTTYADGAHTGNWGTATILNIGWGGSGNAGYPQINGHLKRLIYWPTESGRL